MGAGRCSVVSSSAFASSGCVAREPPRFVPRVRVRARVDSLVAAGPVGSSLKAGDRAITDVSSAAALKSARERASCPTPSADSAARRTHLSASAVSPRAHKELAVESAHRTSSSSSSAGASTAGMVLIVRASSSANSGAARKHLASESETVGFR
jgi:hypothetical protein